MNIETLQVKRVTGSWETNQNSPTKSGEPILINAKVIPNIDYPIFLFGIDGKTIGEIVGSENVFTPKSYVDGVDAKLESKTPTNNDKPKYITSSTRMGSGVQEEDSVGTSRAFAKADHYHFIERDEIESSMALDADVNKFHCRMIKASTSAPTSTTPGNIGDIIIVYSDK